MNSIAKEHLEFGKKKYFRYDRIGALEEFRKALSLDPDEPKLLGWLAITLVQLEIYNEAIEILERYKGDEIAEFFIAQGLLSDQRDGNKQLAINHYSMAISIDPDNVYAYCLRSLKYASQNMEKEASSDLNIALKLNANSYTYGIRGSIKVIQKDYVGALDDFTKAIDLDPENRHAWLEKADTLVKVGDKDRALSEYDKAIEHHPGDEDAWAGRAVLREDMGDAQGALTDYNKAIELDPGDMWAFYRRGSLKRGMFCDYDGALADLNKAIDIDPEYKWNWAERAALREDMGDAQGALTDYNKAIELDPGYMWAIYKRGRLKRWVLSDKKGALVDLNKAIDIDPEYKWNWAERAALREDMGDAQGALADYNKAIELDSEYSWALYKRGTLKHYHLNNEDGALLDYNKVIIIDPTDKSTLSQRGQLLANRGKNKDALNDLNKALSIDNNFTHALSVRAVLWMSLGKYELALADNAKYYELAGIPKFNFNDPVPQDIYNTVYLHFHENIKPTLRSNDERFLEFWACALFWGEDLTQSLYQGKQTYAHHGKYGMGYICLRDRYLRIISLGDLSKKHGKEMGFGIGKKLLLAVLNNYDFRSTEKNDKIWVIPFKDLNGLYKEDNGFRLVTPSETWQVMILLADDDYAQTAFELARTGNLRKMIDIEGLRLKTKSTNSEEDIFEKIERLASLRDNGILTKEEFEQKKQELLARL